MNNRSKDTDNNNNNNNNNNNRLVHKTGLSSISFDLKHSRTINNDHKINFTYDLITKETPEDNIGQQQKNVDFGK